MRRFGAIGERANGGERSGTVFDLDQRPRQHAPRIDIVRIAPHDRLQFRPRKFALAQFEQRLGIEDLSIVAPCEQLFVRLQDAAHLGPFPAFGGKPRAQIDDRRIVGRFAGGDLDQLFHFVEPAQIAEHAGFADQCGAVARIGFDRRIVGFDRCSQIAFRHRDASIGQQGVELPGFDSNGPVGQFAGAIQRAIAERENGIIGEQAGRGPGERRALAKRFGRLGKLALPEIRNAANAPGLGAFFIFDRSDRVIEILPQQGGLAIEQGCVLRQAIHRAKPVERRSRALPVAERQLRARQQFEHGNIARLFLQRGDEVDPRLLVTIGLIRLLRAGELFGRIGRTTGEQDGQGERKHPRG